MECKKKYFSEKNSNLKSCIMLKTNEQIRSNNQTIFPIPIKISKKNFKKNKNLSKKDQSVNNFSFSNLTYNSSKHLSISKEKSKDNFFDVTTSNKFNKYNNDYIQIQFEIDNITKIINENNKNLDEFRNVLKKIFINKINKKKELKNSLSAKESLEEKCKDIINEINNKFNYYLNINENYYVQIELDDIKLNKKEDYIKRIFEVFIKLNIKENKKIMLLKYIFETISNCYQEFYNYLNKNKIHNIYSLINNFFDEMSSKIKSYKNIIECPEIIINYLLRIILKINIISENVDILINYLENKNEENNIKQIIDKIKKDILNLNQKKMNLEIAKNNIKQNIENMNFISNKNSPFCEKTVYKINVKNKELILNKKISSMIHNFIEYNNKSKSFSMRKNNTHHYINNDKKDKKSLTQYLTNDFKDSNGIKKFTSFSNKILKTKISNGNSLIFSAENKNKSRIKLVNNIKNILDISKFKKFSKNKGKQKNSKIFKELDSNNNQTKDSERNLYLNNIDQSTIYNKKSKDYSFIIKSYYFNKNNSSDFNKTQRNYNNKHNKLIIKRIKNDNIFENCEKNNDNNYNLNYNKSSKVLKTTKNKDNINILFNNYFLKRPTINFLKKRNIFINKSPGLSYNNRKTKLKIKNLINNKAFILNNEQINKIKGRNSINFSERSEIDISRNISIKQDIMESFCYYKLIEKNSKFFNPLNNKVNLNQIGYNEGFISISNKPECLIIKSKNSLENNNQKKTIDLKYYNNEYLTLKFSKKQNDLNNNKINNNIELKNINNIYLDKTMKNIIKIHKIFLRYSLNNDKNEDFKNNNNGIIHKKSLNINKILNDRELINIKNMDQNEKIKAGLCNFFSFILEYDSSKKIEFILINYFQFNLWYDYLKNVVSNNIKLKCLVPNGNKSCIIKNKSNIISVLKSFNYKNKSRQKGNRLFKRSYTEKNN